MDRIELALEIYKADKPTTVAKALDTADAFFSHGDVECFRGAFRYVFFFKGEYHTVWANEPAIDALVGYIDLFKNLK